MLGGKAFWVVFGYFFCYPSFFRTNNAQAPSLFSNVTSRRTKLMVWNTFWQQCPSSVKWYMRQPWDPDRDLCIVCTKKLEYVYQPPVGPENPPWFFFLFFFFLKEFLKKSQIKGWSSEGKTKLESSKSRKEKIRELWAKMSFVSRSLHAPFNSECMLRLTMKVIE